MKKAAFAVCTCAAMAVAPAALAQEMPADPGSTGAGAEECSCRRMHGASAAQATQAQAVQPRPAPGQVQITSASIPIEMTPVHREPETITAHQKITPNRPLLYSGLGTLAGSYVATAAMTAARVFNNPDKTMYIPVVGPWLHLKDVPEGARDKILIAGSGVAQAAGLGLTIASLFVPQSIPAATINAAGVKMNVTPAAFGVGSAGALAIGQF